MAATKKIFHERQYYHTHVKSKINSFANIDYKPRPSEKQIFNEHLPWLYYNRPNLPEEERWKIEKKLLINDAASQNQFDRNKQKQYDLSLYESDENSTRLSVDIATQIENDTLSKVNPFRTESDKNDISNQEETPKFRSLLPIGSQKPTASETVAKLRHTVKFSEKPAKHIFKVDISTETVGQDLQNAEVQTLSLEKVYQMNMKAKLIMAMQNSVTIPSFSLDDQNNSDPVYNTQFQELKKYKKLKSKSKLESLSRVTNSFFTTPPQRDEELPPDFGKPGSNDSSSYFLLMGARAKNYSSDSLDFGGSLAEVAVNHNSQLTHVTHASLDYLDQFWAKKRQHLLHLQIARNRSKAVAYQNPNRQKLNKKQINPESKLNIQEADWNHSQNSIGYSKPTTNEPNTTAIQRVLSGNSRIALIRSQRQRISSIDD